MAEEEDHINQAERNERFYDSLCSPDISEEFPEWEVVGLFYAAMHYVNAQLADLGLDHHVGHRDRRLKVDISPEFAPIRHYYHHLYNNSIQARYELYPYSETEVRALESPYQSLKAHILGNLGR